MVWRGLSEANGSWNTICSRLRRLRSARSGRAVRSSPSNRMRPPDGSTSRRIVLPKVDLPQPDSPTRPIVSPRAISSDTPSTACTALRPEV